MALHFVLGPSGAGKTEYIYKKVIQDSMDNPSANFILLVPEQQSLAVQRKMVLMHPRRGSFNIDCIGFNRLTYRLFDELNIKPANVLEDFGKSMLLRQAATEKKDDLSIYGNSLDKAGFIDETKSLMSELYQYDVPRERLLVAVEQLKNNNQDSILVKKIQDMITIFEHFEEKKTSAFVVAEQMMELLAEAVVKSSLIKKSVIVLDGFTGFTPIQLKVIEKLMEYCQDMTVVLTIDEKSYKKKKVASHELFHLSKETMNQLLQLAENTRTKVESQLFLGQDGCPRYEHSPALAHLERNLFRYPYKVYANGQDQIRIFNYDTPRAEIAGVAAKIRELVRTRKFRYKDFAIVSGELEKTADYVDQIFPDYDIPYFLDFTRPVKNNPCVDALGHVLNVVKENFTYDSVFAFLKSGVVKDLDIQDIDILENTVLASGRKGFRSWSQSWKSESDDIRAAVMELLQPIYKKLSGGKKKVFVYVEQLRLLMQALEYEEQLKDMEGLYEKICQLFDKMMEIMPEDKLEIADFYELFQVGLKDLNLGLIPAKMDMAIVGDITRTRLDSVKVLFIVGVNDGVIPKKHKRAQIINDKEKEILQSYDVNMAPTEKMNTYIEQFYLYLNMTKPTDYLYLSYVNMNSANDPMSSSYILDRIKNLFQGLKVENGASFLNIIGTKKSSMENLIFGMQRLMKGDTTRLSETLQLYKAYLDEGEKDVLEKLKGAFYYHNIPESLREDIVKLVRLEDMTLSVSKLEQYAKCAYAFYLRYVLGLEERKIRAIDNRDIGIILHGAMEKVFWYVKEKENGDWNAISDFKRNQLAERFVRASFQEAYQDQEVDTGAYAFLEKTLIRIGKRTLGRLVDLIPDGMVPTFFEHNFLRYLSYGDNQEKLRLQGVVDRGDISIDEKNHIIKLRVIDYKSGNHEFEVGNVYEGVELQISIYMEIMKELVNGIYNKGKKEEDEDFYKIIPDGMYYYHMQDPYVKADTEEKAEEMREKTLKMQGLDASEDKTFEIVTEFAKYKAAEIANAIASGEIEKKPEKSGERSACDYCPYKATCRFDDKHGKNSYHYTKHTAGEKNALLEKMAQKIKTKIKLEEGED